MNQLLRSIFETKHTSQALLHVISSSKLKMVNIFIYGFHCKAADEGHPESVSGGKNVLMGPFDPVMLGQVSIANRKFYNSKERGP
jgi:hypothetical protein